jgi:hypothetical protein
LKVKINAGTTKIEVICPDYTWEWNRESDELCLHDKHRHLFSRSKLLPLLITTHTSGFLNPHLPNSG